MQGGIFSELTQNTSLTSKLAPPAGPMGSQVFLDPIERRVPRLKSKDRVAEAFGVLGHQVFFRCVQ